VTDKPAAPRIAQVMADMARAMQQPGDVALSLHALTGCATDTIDSETIQVAEMFADQAAVGFVRTVETLNPT
jgi:hypothetical protein